MPLLARSFTTPGVARQLAWKISTWRAVVRRMPVVYGVMTHEEHPGRMCCCLSALRGSGGAPTRTPRWEQLQEQIVEALLPGIVRTAAAAWEWSTIPRTTCGRTGTASG
jgi:hypothetical protein